MASPTERLRDFAENWNRMNSEAMRRYIETQTEAMQRYAQANQELFQALTSSTDISAAASAQQAFMQKLQSNATEIFEKQSAIAREAGEEAQKAISDLFQPDAGA